MTNESDEPEMQESCCSTGGSKKHGGVDNSSKMHGGGMPQMMMEMMRGAGGMHQGMRRMGRGMKCGGGMTGAGTEAFPVDIVQDNNDIVVYADLAGYEKENIIISVEDDSLSIIAKRKNIPHSGATYVQERPSEAERRIDLPSSVKEVKEDMIRATYQNGVLEVRLPSLAKKIKIE